MFLLNLKPLYEEKLDSRGVLEYFSKLFSKRCSSDICIALESSNDSLTLKWLRIVFVFSWKSKSNSGLILKSLYGGAKERRKKNRENKKLGMVFLKVIFSLILNRVIKIIS